MFNRAHLPKNDMIMTPKLSYYSWYGGKHVYATVKASNYSEALDFIKKESIKFNNTHYVYAQRIRNLKGKIIGIERHYSFKSKFPKP